MDLMPRLEALVADRPLPHGWSLSSGNRQVTPDATISLEALPSGTPLPRGSFFSGTRYLSASADLADRAFSVSAFQAEERGLLPLESVTLPRRALAVDGLMPGEAGYPFAQRLALSLRPTDAGRRAQTAFPTTILKWLEEVADASASSDPHPLVLASAGDIQVGETQWPLLAGGEAGLASLLRGGVLDLLRKSDVAVANLEAPISSRGTPNPRKRFRFIMPPGSSIALKNAGLDLLLFGNNHGFDYGDQAFVDTLDDLDSAGMPMVGAGRDIHEAVAARFVGTGPNRLAFVGFTFFPDERLGFTVAEAAAGSDKAGVSAEEAAATEAVRTAAASGATVVVLAHGGTEYVRTPSAATRRLYARFADAGAALVVGSHPHLLQGCEARSGSLIAYSLGNFLFTGEAEPAEAWKGAVLEFLLYRGKVRGLMIRPVIAGYDFTTVDPDQDAAQALFAGLCAGLGPLR
jgi:poly-gamma-glutamate synthesis protein (capsule biosynthesis protein)